MAILAATLLTKTVKVWSVFRSMLSLPVMTKLVNELSVRLVMELFRSFIFETDERSGAFTTAFTILLPVVQLNLMSSFVSELA